VVADRTSDLDMHWIDGDTIVVPGALELGCVSISEDDETKWELNMNESISHSKEITSLFAISD
jgi:hypothetical protein